MLWISAKPDCIQGGQTPYAGLNGFDHKSSQSYACISEKQVNSKLKQQKNLQYELTAHLHTYTQNNNKNIHGYSPYTSME